jgi:hypothetical protein
MPREKINWEAKTLPVHADIRGTLIHLYYDKDQSLVQIGEALGVSEASLRAKMIELDIPRRTSGCIGIRWEEMCLPNCCGILQTLEVLHIDQGLNWKQTAKKLGVDYSTLLDKVRALGFTHGRKKS